MLRGANQWLAGYLAACLRRPRRAAGMRHLFFCVADHFEPHGRDASDAEARAVACAWAAEYPKQVGGFRDADGRPPVHTFFYPAEAYDADCVEALVPLCRTGHGEVEVHLHHRGDTAEGLRAQLESFRDVLHRRHGLLGRDGRGAPRYGFIHGNWALCNSRPDGDWCGVNEELAILRATGCYADFTFPSAPSPTQPRTVNAIYYARDHQGRPRGHDRGVVVRAGCGPASVAEEALLLVQGPLALNWRWRKWGVVPRLENAELSGVNPPTPGRIDLWVTQQVHVRGRPDWVFVKVHTHGCVAANRRMLLGEPMAVAHRHLQERYNDGRRWQLHYVSAREMANLAHAAEDGLAGPPGAFRDHLVRPPPCRET